MNIAHDLFAETNPAFGTFILVGFCREYCAVLPSGPSLALIYLAMPIAMSSDTQASFSETNRRTGLLAWINRYPDLRLNLGHRLNASVEIVSASIKLGMASKVIDIVEDGSVRLGANTLVKAPVSRLPQEPKNAIRRAERLGVWMSEAGSPGSIFSSLGVTL